MDKSIHIANEIALQFFISSKNIFYFTKRMPTRLTYSAYDSARRQIIFFIYRVRPPREELAPPPEERLPPLKLPVERPPVEKLLPELNVDRELLWDPE